jgi:hypothetical protein
MNIMAIVIKGIGVGIGPEGVAFRTTDNRILQCLRNRLAGNLAGQPFN